MWQETRNRQLFILQNIIRVSRSSRRANSFSRDLNLGAVKRTHHSFTISLANTVPRYCYGWCFHFGDTKHVDRMSTEDAFPLTSPGRSSPSYGSMHASLLRQSGSRWEERNQKAPSYQRKIAWKHEILTSNNCSLQKKRAHPTIQLTRSLRPTPNTGTDTFSLAQVNFAIKQMKRGKAQE